MEQSAAFNAGQMVGAILLYAGIITIGVYFGNRLARKREDGIFVRWPVGVALAVVLLLLIGQCSAPSRANLGEAADESDEIVIDRKILGDAAGFPTQFDADFLRRWNEGVHDGVVDTIREHDAAIAPESVAVSTEIATFSGHKTLRSKISAPGRMFAYQFAGVSAGNVVVVACASRTAQPFKTAGTECERQAAKTFGD